MVNALERAGVGVLVTLLAACSAQMPQTPTGATAPSPSLTSAESANATALRTYYMQQVTWQPCEAAFECTTVQVPRDYAHPDGSTIELAVTRLKARAPRGSLLLNPGGPGASGVDQAQAAEYVLSPQVRESYDIIGFDPRGVARSTPVDCLSDAQMDAYLSADWTPDTPEEESALADQSSLLASGCVRESPAIAQHMGTADAARDMDILREVLGDPKLNYYGWSYGSYLGQAYSSLFPDKVGRFVLDGILPLTTDLDRWYGEQAVALDAGLRRFATDCLSRPSCPLTGSVDDAIAQIQGLLAQLDKKPLPGADGRFLTESLALAAVQLSLFLAPSSWWDLRSALASAQSGDGRPMLELADAWLGRDSADGSYGNNMNEATWAVNCFDVPASGGVDRSRSRAAEWSAAAPVFGTYNAWVTLPCWEWPAGHDATPLAQVPPASDASPVLVVSTTYDPATPYAWGVEVARSMSGATLLTYDGDGHTAYRRGSMCIDAAVDDYLIEGTLPAAGTTCESTP